MYKKVHNVCIAHQYKGQHLYNNEYKVKGEDTTQEISLSYLQTEPLKEIRLGDKTNNGHTKRCPKQLTTTFMLAKQHRFKHWLNLHQFLSASLS